MNPPARRIVDPRAVPVIGTDAHLPAVSEDRLAPEALRHRFALPHVPPEIPGDGRAFDERTPASASVLVPLVMREDGVAVLLTQRTDHLRDHAGQVSFPGGRAEPDDPGAAGTALREAREEVGLPAEHIEVIGTLPDYRTITNFVVTPVVALVRPGFVLQIDPFEVATAFEVPLVFLMNPAHHRRHAAQLGGVQRQFFSMPWTGPGADGAVREFFIWGATAAMLRNFYRTLIA